MGDFLLGQLSLNYRSSPHFCATFPLCIDNVLFFKNNGLGFISDIFFTNSFGHPDWWQHLRDLSLS
jgi:hypothetical protein